MNQKLKLLATVLLFSIGSTNPKVQTLSEKSMEVVFNQDWNGLLAHPNAQALRSPIESLMTDLAANKLAGVSLNAPESKELCQNCGYALLSLVQATNKKQISWAKDERNPLLISFMRLFSPQITEGSAKDFVETTIYAIENMPIKLAKELNAALSEFARKKTNPEIAARLNAPKTTDESFDLFSKLAAFTNALLTKILPIPPLRVLFNGVVNFFSNLMNRAPSIDAISKNVATSIFDGVTQAVIGEQNSPKTEGQKITSPERPSQIEVDSDDTEPEEENPVLLKTKDKPRPKLEIKEQPEEVPTT